MSAVTDIQEIDVMLKNIEATMDVIKVVLARMKERESGRI